MSDEALLQAAVFGPVAAALVWLAASRWPWARRAAGGLFALAALAATYGVFWRLYQGGAVTWRGFDPGLAQTSILAAAQTGVALAAVRAERLGPAGATGAIVGLGVASSALAAGALSTSLIVVALALPFTTLGALVAGLTGRGRAALAGLAGLAAADAVGVIGLLVHVSRTGTSLAAAGAGIGLGAGLLLVSAAVKAGAVPGLGTARLAASEGPAAPLAAALRGQGIALAALATLTLGGVGRVPALVVAAALAALASGAAAALARGPNASFSGAAGVGSALVLLAAGLGGGVGARAFLLLTPAVLLAGGLMTLVGWHDGLPRPGRPWSRWAGPLAGGVAVASVIGLPPGGGFPGAWLALHLTAVRGEAEPLWIAVTLAAGAGIGLAAVGAVTAIRTCRPRAGQAALASAAALGLLYAGTLPVRLALGWLVRAEAGLGLPRLLPSSGAPVLPALGGAEIVVAVLAAAVPVAALVALGRGVRRDDPVAAPAIPLAAPGGWVGRVIAPVRGARRWVESLEAGAWVAVALELAALGLAGWLVGLGAERGFL